MELSAYIKAVLNEFNDTDVTGEISFEVSLSQDGVVVDNGTNFVRFTINLEDPEEDE